MKNSIRTGLLSSVFVTSTVALTMATAIPAVAQVTTSDIVGTVTSEAGVPIGNALVTVENTKTGFARSVTTDGAGNFTIRGLSVTGQYNVSVNQSGYQGERIEGLNLSLGSTSNLSFQLSSDEGEDEIIVVAQQSVVADVAVGPSANFGIVELERAPAINRNITDILRIDPRIYVDESRGGINGVRCVGQNDRFNSFTLDGVNLNDSFGLNSNGYPTERVPYPFDSIEQVSVEISPFDVEYGGFTACAINSVTKSGTNETHGKAFIDYTDRGLRGKKAGDQDFTFDPFDEIRYGINVNGPIIKDKLFFNVAYEKLEGVNTYSNPIQAGTFSQSDIDRIAQISQNVYQYDPGTVPTNFDNSDEKIIAKLDWNINSDHRAALTYIYNDGFNIVRSDGDPNEFEFSNHLYERGAELNSWTGAIFSSWSDNFSTEINASYLNLDNRQLSLGGTDFGEMQIRTPGGTVYLGSDDSRQSNKLEYDVIKFNAKAYVDLGDFNLTFGIGANAVDIFNLFIQHTETEIRFNSIDDFENQLAQRIYYNNNPLHVPNNAAADWAYAVGTAFWQVDWDVTPDLKLIGGLRSDAWVTNDRPTENPDFLSDYGFSNSQTLDRETLLQPRLAFKWDATDKVSLRGGIGKYSGGDPNVWLSNTYSANNIDQVGALARAGRGDFSSVSAIDLSTLTYVDGEDGVPNGPGWAIPTIVHDAVSTGMGSNFEINYLDPDFKIPSQWKFALGFEWDADEIGGSASDWMVFGDVIFSKGEDTAIIQRGDLVQTGTQVVDGITVPTYDSPGMDSFVLTNSDVGNESFVASLGISADWESGWGLTMGYAYSDAKDVQPMTSSVAFSNYNNRAFTDPNEDILSVSNYNTKHRFTATVDYSKDFWEDYDTSFFLYFQHSTGAPYSRVAGNPNSFYNFTPFLDSDGILQAGTARNEFTGPSWTKMDLKISQDLPGLRSDDRAQVFMVIDNLTNLIDSDWGVLEVPGFPGTLTANEGFSTNAASLYEIRFGMSYDF